MKRSAKFCIVISLLGAGAVCAGDTRVKLIPELHVGQTITYLIRYRSDKNVKTESNVVAPMAPNAAQLDDIGLLRSTFCCQQPQTSIHGAIHFESRLPACGCHRCDDVAFGLHVLVAAVADQIGDGLSDVQFRNQFDAGVTGADCTGPRREITMQNFADRFMLMLIRTKAEEASFFRILEMAVEKIAGSTVCLQPMPVQQKIMHVIGENELPRFPRRVRGGVRPNRRLREINVAVVIAMNEEHGRLPGVHGGHGEESWASLVNSGEIFFPSQLSVGQSWTPWMSTPAANRSELRPSPSAVK